MREEKEEKILMATVNATASHDTRNPLNAIHAQNLVMNMLAGQISDLVEMIGTRNFNLNRFKRRLKNIHRKLTEALHVNGTSERFLTLMIEDYLDLQQLRSNNFRRINSTFDVCKPVQEVIEIISFKAKHNSIKLEQIYELVSAQTKICFDERRLIQILLNLVSNAVKFTPMDGTITIKVRLIKANSDLGGLLPSELRRFYNTGDLLEVSVSDTGIGIGEEDMSKLFKMNGFLKKTEEINTRGIGLGLHICRELVRKLGGDIICESEWQKGSTFTFVVKVELVDDSHALQNKIERLLKPNQKRVFPCINIQKEVALRVRSKTAN